MASRVQQDVFIDDSDDTCPLCVEEFDLSDRNFKPCPCGYKICQFCFNNIRNNLNGLCPACRRPYDDKTIEWKVVSPEEFKADLAQQARKKAAARQKEAQKREVEVLNRKHLSGLRVVQKNLVYVVGLNPKIREEDLLQTLRGEQYFGQYGKIVKIVVSKAKDGSHPNHSLGVYVTYARKQDAATCIAAVDGSQNGDRVLRAQYGTTKYCSAYLRNEQCMNRNCMFLHEPGEENDSFTRQDLSSMNVVSTQRPGQSSNPNQPQPQPPPQQTPQTIAAATMTREMSREGTGSPAESGDGSALPATVNWATKQQDRRTSHPTSAAVPSPRILNAAVAPQSVPEPAEEDKSTGIEEPPFASEPSTPAAASPSPTVSPDTPSQRVQHLLRKLLKSVCSPTFKFNFAEGMFTAEELEAMRFLPLFDNNGGIKRRAVREQEEKERQELEEEEVQAALQQASAGDFEENTRSGSLQLGGEPDVQPGSVEGTGESLPEPRRQVIQPPSQQPIPTTTAPAPGFSTPFALANNLSNLTINGRSLTPLQQQQLLLLRSGNTQASNVLDQYSQNLGLAQNAQPNAGLFQNQQQHLAAAQGHMRHSSRFTFANDSASASASVKPAANAKLMAQQSSMMPTNAHQLSQQLSQHQPLGQFHGTTVQGPPPGLKPTGTPPVTGGGMFGQGHGFANAMGGGIGFGSANLPQKENGADLMRELIRGRSATSSTGTGQFDAAKREYMISSFLHHYPSTSTPAPAPGLLSSLYGGQSATFQDAGPQKQKKKGKKHRHANTSSSGGGGIVDLADPSILQARMHQANAGSGQGLFGGHGQGGYNPASMMYSGGFGRW
ncbi:hypothetical protein L228DRAFT_248789 [Xylona heveae TC161]|uniref:RING-type domain-containing protein n=1 Tax=Xylona heveae (strain CBS 132557 / TC161) TaxID=1328760 RepID=A0A165FJ55_XYLHT|nr:hypothetical protein L228DRAFT_248789 [Xylona heveae TC161]KZF21037.1 hypothetical protein L228DRAFT_248789 [Xylona heveae TC161]